MKKKTLKNGDKVEFDYGDGERYGDLGVFVGLHPVTASDSVVMRSSDEKLEIVPTSRITLREVEP